MGERGGDVDDVLGAQAEVLDVVFGGARQHVVAVKRALGLARRARGEQELRHLLRGLGWEGCRPVGPSSSRPLIPVREHDHVLERRQGLAQASRHRCVIAAAERVRDEQDTSVALAQHELELALAEDRHERLAHGAGAQRAQRDGHELEAVRELECHRLALEDGEPEQRRRDPGRLVLQSSPSQFANRSVRPDLDDRSLARSLPGVPVEIVEDHRTSSSAGTSCDTAAGMPSAFMWSRNSG